MRRNKKNKRKSPLQAKKPKKVGSLAFYLAVPTCLISGLVLLAAFIVLLPSYEFNKDIWTLFTCGFIGMSCLLLLRAPQRLLTFIHELKHAVVIILTGNRLTAFKVMKDSGYVNYRMYQDRLHFVPFIILAPYFFPLFSAPVLVVGIIFELQIRPEITGILGMALALDLLTNYWEFHPYQRDLREVFGGLLPIITFLIGISMTWVGLVLIWVHLGRQGYFYLGMMLLHALKQRLGIV